MVKLIAKAGILVASFFALWIGLRQLDWISILHVKDIRQTTEEKLGELYWRIYSQLEEEITDQSITAPVDSIVYRICTANDIDVREIKCHIIRKDQINAFALPDYHLVLFTGLIRDSESEAELSGVIAHELAHMEKGHIMKKLVKEIGLSMLISMTSGKGGPETVQHALKILSSTAYDRNLESEADVTAVDYLINAGINPEGFANFMFRMSTREGKVQNQLSWISTHPNSEERAKTIVDQMEGKSFEQKSVLDSIAWTGLRDKMIDK